MGAKFILGPLGFPYSITPGAVPAPELVNTAGIAINIADHILFSKDHEGNMFTIGTSYDAILAEHFTADNPHGTWDKQVLVTLLDTDVDNSKNETIIRRFGAGDATITIKAGIDIGNEVVIDNVWSTSGTVTITCEEDGAVIHVDETISAATHTLTGKAQFRMVKISAKDFGIVELVQ